MADYVDGTPINISPQLKSDLKAAIEKYRDIILKEVPPSKSDSFNVFDGHAGRAFFFLKLWKTEADSAQKAKYLDLAKQYVDVSLKTIKTGYTSFFEGPAGPYALGSIIYDLLGDKTRSKELLASLVKEFSGSSSNTVCTLDEGKAGLIWAGVFVNNYFKSRVISGDLLWKVANETVAVGRQHGFPNGTMQWPTPIFSFMVIGQGHGGGGVVRALLEVPELLNSSLLVYVQQTLNWYVSLQLASGNFPTPNHKPYLDECFPDQGLDCLVQWCHGSPGFVGLLSKAYEVFKTISPSDAQRYLQAANRAADNMWERGLLTKGLMFCHGIGGNAYLFLEHSKRTGSRKSLWRALQFTSYSLVPSHISPDVMRVGDTPNSMFQGTNAVAMLYADLLSENWATDSHLPGYDPDAL